MECPGDLWALSLNVRKIWLTVKQAPGCATTTCSALKNSPVRNGHAWSTPSGRYWPYILSRLDQMLWHVATALHTAERESPMNWNTNSDGVYVRSFAPCKIFQTLSWWISLMRTSLRTIDSRFILLFCQPSTLIRTTVVSLFRLLAEEARGITLLPADTFTVVNAS